MTVKIFTLLLCFQISFAHACQNSDKRWFLVGNSVSDITTSTLERELERFLSTKPAGLLLPLDKYIFQYKFLQETKVKIHGLCIDEFNTDELTDEFIVVRDGGNCFFSIDFDIRTKTFDHLNINGLA